MPRDLITGGLGYVGSNLAKRLLDNREEVVIFDMLSSSKSIESFKSDVQVIQGQLGNMAEVLNAVQANDIDCIYHLGAMITMPAEANPWSAYNTNANGTYHILEAARLFNIDSVVFPSGIVNYGREAPEVITDDTFQSNPSQMYAVTKIFGERLGEYYHHKFGVNFRCVRFPAICGPGRRDGLAAYASLMVHEAAKGRLCQLPINEKTQIPFIYIKDAIRSLTSLKNTDEGNLSRRVYNIDGFSVPAKKMADTVRRYIPDARIEFLADQNVVKLASALPKKMDAARAREDWGWKPEYDWDRTVQDFIAEVRAHPDFYE
jgi:threonine 3-dehydrogenase